MSLITLRARIASAQPSTVALTRCTRSHPARRSLTSSPFPSRLAFAFDIDGVLKQGHANVLPQARRVMQLLLGADGRLPRPVPFIVMTNSGGVPDDERRAALSSELGVELGKYQVVQSHTPLRALVAAYADKPVLVVGGRGDSCRRVAESYGLKHAYIPQDVIAWRPSIWDRTELTEEERAFVKPADFSTLPIAAILVLHDTHDWGRDATLILELMSSVNGVFGTQRPDRRRQKDGGEVPLVFSNPDLEWRSEYPLLRLGMGAFSLAVSEVYKATTGLDLPFTQYGKPHAPTYAFADDMLRQHAAAIGANAEALSVYMVGDNPASDIAGANAHGWHSILLRTGVYQGGEPAHRPTVICDDVEQGVWWAIEREAARR
ncbi:hypothetical protein Q5752_001001 [Cryptotrichosporon argae]